MGNSSIECKTVVEQRKRKLRYVNNKTKKSYIIVVGARGGLSVKPPGSKSRRYIKKECKKNGSKYFWETAEQMKNKKAKTMKKK